MSFTIIGFQLRVLGQAPAAARFAGFSAARMVWLCLLLSGGVAALAVLFEVAGPLGQLVPSNSPGTGFTSILAAFLGDRQSVLQGHMNFVRVVSVFVLSILLKMKILS